MTDYSGQAEADLGPPIEAGEWKGWQLWTGEEPFEHYAGPFYARRSDDGSMLCGFRPGPNNLNGGGAVHGGALMTFADYALFIIAYDALRNRPGVTISCNSEFVGAAHGSELLTARGDVLRSGRSLVFVRGVIDMSGQPVLNFSGIIKTSAPRG